MRARLFSWAFIALLLATGVASAQQGTSELRGRVEDAQGGVLPGVSVIVTNQATGMFRETISGEDGSFIASGLVPGTYQVTAELQGFKKFERKELRLEVGKTTSVDVAMQVGGLEETVNVTAESPIVDLTSKEIGGNITSDTLVKLPSVNGNFIGFVGLLPGIVPSVSTESFGSDSISVNGQDPAQQQLHARRRQQQRRRDRPARRHAGAHADRSDPGVPGDHRPVRRAVRPHLGRRRQRRDQVGHQQLQGRGVRRSCRMPSLTENHFFAKQQNLPKPDTQYQRWGGTFGGPIVKNKMHFFGSLERFSIDRPNAINIPSRPEYNGTRADPGPGVEHDHPRRSPGQQHHHLQRPLAA